MKIRVRNQKLEKRSIECVVWFVDVVDSVDGIVEPVCQLLMYW